MNIPVGSTIKEMEIIHKGNLEKEVKSMYSYEISPSLKKQTKIFERVIPISTTLRETYSLNISNVGSVGESYTISFNLNFRLGVYNKGANMYGTYYDLLPQKRLNDNIITSFRFLIKNENNKFVFQLYVNTFDSHSRFKIDIAQGNKIPRFNMEYYTDTELGDLKNNCYKSDLLVNECYVDKIISKNIECDNITVTNANIDNLESDVNILENLTVNKDLELKRHLIPSNNYSAIGSKDKRIQKIYCAKIMQVPFQTVDLYDSSELDASGITIIDSSTHKMIWYHKPSNKWYDVMGNVIK